MKPVNVVVGPWTLAIVVGLLVAYGAGVFLVTRSYYVPDAGRVAYAVPAPSTARITPAPARSTAIAPAPGENKQAVSGRAFDTKYFRSPDQPAEPSAPASASTAALGDDVVSIAERADQAYAERDYERAAAGYKHALELAPDNTDLQNNLGLVLYYVGRIDESIAHLEAATERNPHHQRTWLTLGFVRMSTSGGEKAKLALNRARDIDPDNVIGQRAASYLNTLK